MYSAIIFPPDGRSFDDELKMIHPNDIPLFSESILSAASGNPPEKTYLCAHVP
jgi:hypothetical protein